MEKRAGGKQAIACAWSVVFAACAAESQPTRTPLRQSDDRVPVVEASSEQGRLHRVKVDGSSTIAAWIEPDTFDVGEDEIQRWVERSATIVSAYFGVFPLPHATVLVVSRLGAGVQSGTTTPRDGGTIRVSVGREVSATELASDWVLVHEMIHLAIPCVGPEQHWFEEGAATYVEPIARAQAGELAAEVVWRDLMRGVPRGLADARADTRNGGLDNTDRWGATYWGGALFFLLADVRIRELSHNELSLEDALIAVARAGGSICDAWPIERVIATADAAVGRPVLANLYRDMGLRAPSVDLDRLWSDLGLSLAHGRVKMDDSAPLAEVRRAITERR